MERRELLKMIAVLTGGAVIGGEVFLSGCKQGAKSDAGFTAANIALLDEVGETIIPTTDTPGAKAAKIGAFMQTIVTDCYTAEQQQAFTKGMLQLNKDCEKANGKSFTDCSPEQRHEILVSLEKEAKAFNSKRDEAEKVLKEKAKQENKYFESGAPHYYTMMKQLTLLGYFTSEIGQTKALRLLPVPGKYDGAHPYKKGDKAWAI